MNNTPTPHFSLLKWLHNCLPFQIFVGITFTIIFLITSTCEAQTYDSIPKSIDSIILLQLKNSSLNIDSNKNILKTVPIKQTSGKKTIEGHIKDFTTSEALSFATVFFPGTGTGIKTDLDGNFKFVLDQFPKDSLSFSVIGYAKKTIYK